MYTTLIFQHIKLALDVLALKLYLHTLMKIQKLSIKIGSSAIHFGTIFGSKATTTIELYGQARTKEITFRYKVRGLIIPEPRFTINKF